MATRADPDRDGGRRVGLSSDEREEWEDQKEQQQGGQEAFPAGHRGSIYSDGVGDKPAGVSS